MILLLSLGFGLGVLAVVLAMPRPKRCPFVGAVHSASNAMREYQDSTIPAKDS